MRTALLIAGLIGLIGIVVLFAMLTVVTPGDPPLHQEVFEKAFAPGFEVTTPSEVGSSFETIGFRTIAIGDLIIKSGRICAADPFVSIGDTKPYVQAVPNGRFPVRLAVGDHPAGNAKDSRIAFARVDFSSAPVVRWQMAVNEEQNLAKLKAGEIFGYGVDAGTGSFYDPLVDAPVKALLAENPDATMAWQNEGEELGPKLIGPYSFVLMLPMGEVNVAMFHSGWGDGFYASWFGYDAAGSVAALLTDFATIDWSKARW